MSDENASAPPQPGPALNIGEEFGTARRNLPPAGIVLIALALVGLVLAAMAFLQRAQPQAAGSIDDIAYAEVPNQNSVLVALNLTLRNTGKKPLWIHALSVMLKTGSSEFSDQAASAVDFDRYFQAFPVLKTHALEPLTAERKIQPGDEVRGTVIVSFPVTEEVFQKRQSLTVTIAPYDQPRKIVLTR